MISRLLTLVLASAVVLAGCTSAQVPEDPQLVVATTTIVGDLVEQVGHGTVQLEVLMPIGADPRDFRPSAHQTADLRNADLIVTSGLGLESGLVDALAAARAAGIPILDLGDNLRPLSMGGDDDARPDPHWWLDPNRAAAAIDLIAERLSASSHDPALCLKLAPRAEAARSNLLMLGQQMTNALRQVPPEHRRLFASQDELRYFAERFDFETGGVIGHGADVVFIDSTEPAGLAEVLADEMGTETEVVALDLCSLGGPGSGRETYIDMMWATADRIVEALT